MAQGAAIAVRPFQVGDEALLADVWRAALPADPVDLETLTVKVLADPNFDAAGVLVAVADERPVGFVLTVARRVPLGPDGDLEAATGWITAFGVHPEARRQGVATALLDAAEAYLRARGCERIEVGPYAPHYFWPGTEVARHAAAIALLQARGYRRLFEAVAMDKNLVGFAVPPDVQELQRVREGEGYRFQILAPRYVRPLIAFNERVFYPDWARAMREAILRRVPWDRTWLCLDPADAVVGFAQFGAYDHVPDRFGPFGVEDGLRGKGLGKILLYRTLEAMAAKGLHNAWFLWTGERTPAGYLYHRAGFTVTSHFETYGRPL